MKKIVGPKEELEIIEMAKEHTRKHIISLYKISTLRLAKLLASNGVATVGNTKTVYNDKPMTSAELGKMFSCSVTKANNIARKYSYNFAKIKAHFDEEKRKRDAVCVVCGKKTKNMCCSKKCYNDKLQANNPRAYLHNPHNVTTKQIKKPRYKSYLNKCPGCQVFSIRKMDNYYGYATDITGMELEQAKNTPRVRIMRCVCRPNDGGCGVIYKIQGSDLLNPANNYSTETFG